MDKEKDKDAKARLENLSVREVSIVDRPANQRRFLIVKKASGGASNEVLELLKTEDHAMRKAIVPSQAAQHGIVVNYDTSDNQEPIEKNAEFSSFLDVLGIIDDNAEDSERSEDDHVEVSADIEAELIPITKDVKQTALGEATKILESLMASVNQAKTDGDVNDKVKSTVQNVSQAIKNLASKLGGKDTGSNQPTDKGGDVVSKLTAALEKLIAIVEKIKKLDDSVDQVPGDIIQELNALSAALAGMLQPQAKEPPQEEKQEKAQVGAGDTAVEIFTRDIENDVAVVLKAGSKMSKSRLSSLKKAVEILSSIITEIEGSPEDKKDDKKDVKKVESPPPIDETKIIEEVKKSLGEDITKQLKELVNTVSVRFEAIKKRIDDIEDARPAGNTDFDPPAKVEKKRSLFSNIIPI